MSDKRKISWTRNHDLFSLSPKNRPLDLKKHRALYASMQKYGYIGSFPVVCFRTPDGILIVKDGQHRLHIARELGLAVAFVEEHTDFDIATINSTAKGWSLSDYVHQFAVSGNPHYQIAAAFASNNKIPLGHAFALLAGVTSPSYVHPSIVTGTFTIEDRSWADAVAAIYVPLSTLSPAIRNVRFLSACMAVCRIPDFDSKRLLSGAERCLDKLKPYSNRDAYLDMLETIYNYGRSKLAPLKLNAINATRERSAAPLPPVQLHSA
jgi:hypothetical protein